MQLKTLSYNIRFGGKGRESEIAEVIQRIDPDMVVLQEATDPKVVANIAENAGFPFEGSRPGHSVGFLSRVEIESFRWHDIRGVRRPFLEIKPAGLDVTIFGIHLSAVHSNLTESIRQRELKVLLNVIEPSKESFHVLTGDFNTLAPGELLEHSRLPRRLRFTAWVTGGRVRYRTIGVLLEHGYTDAYRSLHEDSGYTFPTWDPHVRLDFLFLPNAFSCRLLSCEVGEHDGLSRQASDHLPLITVIDIPKK